MKECQQDADSLLFIPGKNEGKRKVIDTAAECICQSYGDLNRTVGIIALSDIHDARESRNSTEIQVIESVLSACQCQNNGIFRRLLYELRIIVSSCLSAVAATDKEEVADFSCLDCLNDLSSMIKNEVVTKTGRYRMAAVDACHHVILRITAQRQRLLDHRCEILFRSDVLKIREGNHICRENAVLIGSFRRHQAVGREQDRRRNICEFLLLILPCRTKVALEMRILLQCRISVRRQHLTVCIDIHALAFCLLQKKLQILQVVSCDDNERTLLNRERNLRRLRIAIGFRIRLIKKCHALQVDLTCFQNQRKKLICRHVLSDGKETLTKEAVYIRITVSQHAGMMRISRHASEAEQDQGFQRTDILVRVPHLIHIVIFVVSAGIGAGIAERRHNIPLNMCQLDLLSDGLRIEIHVGDRHEKSVNKHLPGLIRNLSVGICRVREADQRTCQFILKFRNVCRFSADTCSSCAGFASCCLFTLKTKHITHLSFLLD